MKKTVRVTIEKEFEIELKDEVLTPEFIKEFESYMWELDGTLERQQKELFEYAARQIALYDLDFIEGLGKTASIMTAPYHEKQGKVVNVVWKGIYDDVETEVVE